MASENGINRLKESSHHVLNSGNSKDLQTHQYESLQLERCFGAWKIHMCSVGYVRKENIAHNEGKSVKQKQHMQLFLTLTSSLGLPQILRFFGMTHKEFFCIFLCLLASCPPVILTVMKAKMLLLLNNY